MPTKFTTEIKTLNAEIGIAAWQEQSAAHYPDNIHVAGLSLLVVKLLDLNKIIGGRTGYKRTVADDPEFEVQSQVEEFLASEAAQKLADAYELDYHGNSLPIVQAGNDTWFVWLNWTGTRDYDTDQPGAREWLGSRGVPTTGRAH